METAPGDILLLFLRIKKFLPVCFSSSHCAQRAKAAKFDLSQIAAPTVNSGENFASAHSASRRRTRLAGVSRTSLNSFTPDPNHARTKATRWRSIWSMFSLPREKLICGRRAALLHFKYVDGPAVAKDYIARFLIRVAWPQPVGIYRHDHLAAC
jgi:hypothetical protein